MSGFRINFLFVLGSTLDLPPHLFCNFGTMLSGLHYPITPGKVVQDEKTELGDRPGYFYSLSLHPGAFLSVSGSDIDVLFFSPARQPPTVPPALAASGHV